MISKQLVGPVVGVALATSFWAASVVHAGRTTQEDGLAVGLPTVEVDGVDAVTVPPHDKRAVVVAEEVCWIHAAKIWVIGGSPDRPPTLDGLAESALFDRR